MKIIFRGDNMSDYNKDTVLVKDKSRFFLVAGWISAVVSLFAYPFIFGVLGVVMGILAAKRGSKGGLPLIIASMALMAVGLIFSGVILNNLARLWA